MPCDGQPIAIGIRPPAACPLFLAEFPARNPKSKVPKPVEHCQCGAQREQGEQYIDRRRRAVQWTERFAPKSAPITNSVEIWRVCASAVVGLPLYWAILRFLVKGIGWRDCAALSNAGLFTIRNGARGQAGRARGELKTVRPGAATRERFLEGEGEKRFGVAAGMPCGFGSAHAAAAAGAGFSAIPVRSVTRPGTRQGRHPD